ncbi:NADH dehydrogenase [ubiquinone] 1 beta subcomplex subunit 10-like [Centruroides sculpturatus]|uniref:NADH dehydrogenase [ubiquinone] 1 beta subcomplex subunit 10-like n=1 Tax=Centruroides sculpturatus TaxID=218467 RepID=UPI000C6E0CD0|nr:NADH dehydrogenase [ubiquinone] 1 beta subcomplex subunit 10-like [Centruroides sculpturatus]
MSDSRPSRSPFDAFFNGLIYMIDAPVTWAREKIVANRPKYYYYHEKFRRVPTIDECEIGDVLCYYEANEQYKRDKAVDTEILNLLRLRRDDCVFYESPDHKENCKKVLADYEEAALNWFIKYGDLSGYATVRDCYMKQKHRLIWERRQQEKLESNKIE